ncbi:Putative ribonuclease H protein At1g65750 [Linum grandiflorum]
MIGWRPGDEGWFTLSTDGSLRSPQRMSAAGGVIRDDRGSFVKAFTMNLGCYSITRAEMRGIVEGLNEANCTADYLANLGHSFNLGFHIVDSPDRGLSHWLRYDVIGVSLPRSVRILNTI